MSYPQPGGDQGPYGPRYPTDASPRSRQPLYPPGQYPAAGYPGYPPPPYGYPQRVGNSLATAGMVCGIASILLFWLAIIGWILAILGITFGGIGLARANQGAPNRGFAIAGIACGVVSLAGWVILFVVALNSAFY